MVLLKEVHISLSSNIVCTLKPLNKNKMLTNMLLKTQGRDFLELTIVKDSIKLNRFLSLDLMLNILQQASLDLQNRLPELAQLQLLCRRQPRLQSIPQQRGHVVNILSSHKNSSNSSKKRWARKKTQWARYDFR